MTFKSKASRPLALAVTLAVIGIGFTSTSAHASSGDNIGMCKLEVKKIDSASKAPLKGAVFKVSVDNPGFAGFKSHDAESRLARIADAIETADDEATKKFAPAYLEAEADQKRLNGKFDALLDAKLDELTASYKEGVADLDEAFQAAMDAEDYDEAERLRSESADRYVQEVNPPFEKFLADNSAERSHLFEQAELDSAAFLNSLIGDIRTGYDKDAVTTANITTNASGLASISAYFVTGDFNSRHGNTCGSITLEEIKNPDGYTGDFKTILSDSDLVYPILSAENTLRTQIVKNDLIPVESTPVSTPEPEAVVPPEKPTPTSKSTSAPVSTMVVESPKHELAETGPASLPLIAGASLLGLGTGFFAIRRFFFRRSEEV